MSRETFVEVLGTVFEDTPAIAGAAWEKRPFADVAALHQTMMDLVHNLTLAEQLQLIRAHPDLGSKAKMAEASVKEQTGAGLDRLNAEEYQRFHALNQVYKTAFGFPFIIAVKNHTKTSILESFEQRLQNTAEVERQQALAEIIKIARFRLLDRVIDSIPSSI